MRASPAAGDGTVIEHLSLLIFGIAVNAVIWLRIQARLPGAAAGQIAIADSGEGSGRVSLTAAGATGNVAIAPGMPEQG